MGKEEQSREDQLNYDELLLRFGVNAAEANQSIEFGGHSGTLGQMLLDDKCPVGAMVEQAHTEGGPQAVSEKLEGINGLFGSDIPTGLTDKSEDDYAFASRNIVEDQKKN